MTRPVTDILVDRAYDVMCEELGHWQIIGPQKEQPSGREFFTAVRRNEVPQVFVEQPKPSEIANDVAMSPIRVQHFVSREYAVACVQWHGLQAVLSDRMIQDGIGG